MIASADAVVVGGGVIGAACAEALSRTLRRVVLVERLGLASGTSSACQSGVGHGLFADDWDLSFDRAAIDAYRTMEDGLDAGYSRCGALLVCTESDAPPVRARIARLNALGLSVDWIDEAALRSLEPNLAPDYAGAARLNDMGQVSPMRLAVEMTRRAVARGATILTNTEVTGIETTRGRVTAVLAASGRIATSEVIIAAGVWSRDVARMAGLNVPIWPLKGHVMVTEPLPGFLHCYLTEAEYEIAAASFAKTEMTVDGPRPGPARTAAVLQPLPSGQILIGSSREFASDREVSRQRIAQIAERAARVVPALADRWIIRSYAGLRPWTPDGRPLIGRAASLAGVTIAAGHGGEGNTRSLVTGRIVADLIMGAPPHIDIRPLSPDRFDLRLPATAA